MSTLSQLVKDQRANTILSWLIIVVLAGLFVESALDLDVLWTGFLGVMIFVAVVPVMAYRNTSVMLPWEVLMLAALPAFLHSWDQPLWTSVFFTYLSAATLALMIAVQLHLFTKVELSHRFAVLLVVIGTMAASGIWAVLQWMSDTYLGTQFLTTNTALMGAFLIATGAGLIDGLLFDLYFRQLRDEPLRTTYEEQLFPEA